MRIAPAALGVTAVALCGFFAIGVVLPVLPRYVQGPIGGGEVAAGVVFGIFAVSALLSRPIAGRLAGRLGGRVVLLGGLVLATVAGALLFVPLGVPSLIVARLTIGAAEGFMAIGGTMLAIELAPDDRRGRAIGVFGLSFWIGLSLGALAGDLIFRAAGYDAVWAVATIAPVAGAVAGRRLPAPTREAPARRLPTGSALATARSLGRALLPSRPAVGPGALLALGGYGYAAMTGFAVLHAEAEGIANGATVLTMFAATSVLARLLAGGLPDRLGGRRGAMVAFATEGAGLAVVATSSSLVPAAAGACLAGFGVALMFPSLTLLVLDRVDEGERAAAIGGFAAFLDIGVAVSGPLSGAVAALAGYPAAFWLASALAAAAAVGAARAEPTAGRVEAALATPEPISGVARR